ncbi:MAG: AAA family ATPase [Deltaproteobacteria bacterium]|nr:AAA family ATPase [Deltaproteobacteria bacterium]
MPSDKLKAEDLAWSCDTSSFTFKTTEDLPDLRGFIGQSRAIRAIDFGLGVTNNGFNVYVLGDSGTGKTSTIKTILDEKAAKGRVPDDWCYVFNFDEPDRPNALRLAAGAGHVFASDMQKLLEGLKREIPKVFESKDYERHRDEILEGQQERTRAIFSRLEKLASEKGFMLKKSVSGVAVVPAKDGHPLKGDDFDALPRHEKNELEENSKRLQEKLNDAIRDAKAIENETRDKVEKLDREVVQYVVMPMINELLGKYARYEEVVTYIEDVRDDVFKSIEDFRPKEEPQLPIPIRISKPEPTFERYQVNLIVNNKDVKGAPVVIETNPTYYNLFGRVEHKVQYGVAVTDFTLIKAGSMHRANGGYLVVNAMDVLKNIFVYDTLKRMINTGEVRIEDVWEQYRLMSTSALKPEPIPVNVKVVLIGEPYLYYLLYNLDPEYRKLFKVKSDFDSVMDLDEGSLLSYCHFIASRCREKNLLPFDKSAVGRVIERGARIAGNQNKLTTRFGIIENIIMEASYWAGAEGRKIVTAADVDKSERERIYRNSKIEEKLREYITDDTIMVSTDGKVVGQLNGIAVLDPGDYAFGKPSRVTATAYMGDAGIVSIEREVKMSGRIHSKAQYIVRSFLGERFSKDFPLAFSASVCFEQLYDEIEGDSATCTEYYAIMSAVSGVPLDQSFAVTGSMNQRGEVQPIGGVNEKIEGFFDVCAAKGLTGHQGVIIPRRNVRNLMLKAEVRDAVKKGKFSIHPIDYVDEGLSILSGMKVGERGKDGKFPDGTLNGIAERKLRELAESLKNFGKPKDADKKKRKKVNNNSNGK